VFPSFVRAGGIDNEKAIRAPALRMLRATLRFTQGKEGGRYEGKY